MATNRIAPQSQEAETYVLGAILWDSTALDTALEILRAEDFYLEKHRNIFNAMIELSSRNAPIETLSIAGVLKAQDRLESVGGEAYIGLIGESVTTAANIAYYANIVREKSRLRNVINAAQTMLEGAYESAGDIDELVDAAERAVFEITSGSQRPSFVGLDDSMVEALKDIEASYDRKQTITGVSTGYIDLDNLTAGLQTSDLIIVAGRPSMGKTALALNMAVNAALGGVGAGVFSLEMSRQQLVLRLICSEARIGGGRIRSGYLSDADFPRIASAANRLASVPLYIDDSPALTILELRARARRLMRQRKIGLLVVDYLQLMRGPKSASSREQEIAEISRSLKALAKELNVPVIALSQLNRKVEDRSDKRPQMSDLRESGAIEQDADVIMFIYREEVYNPNNLQERGVAEVNIAKQRNGPTGGVRLMFQSEYTRFDNLSERDDDVA